ncbi:MAG: hypothetical protein Q9184_005648 [Pyrenodesmia sp. 2 TL-2023]
MSDRVRIFWNPYLKAFVIEVPARNHSPSATPPIVVTSDDVQAPPTRTATFLMNPNAPLGSFYNPIPHSSAPTDMAASPMSIQVPTQVAPQPAQLPWPQDPTAPLGSFQNPVPYESCMHAGSAASPPPAVSSPASDATAGLTAQPQDWHPTTADIGTPFSPPPPNPSPNNGTMQHLVPNAVPAPSPDRDMPLSFDINAISDSLQPNTPEERSSYRQIPTRSNSGRRVHFHDEEVRTQASRDAEARAAARARENEAEVHDFIDAESANRQGSTRWRPRTLAKTGKTSGGRFAQYVSTGQLQSRRAALVSVMPVLGKHVRQRKREKGEDGGNEVAEFMKETVQTRKGGLLKVVNCPMPRRTHQSGPLGELFDHGVDACNTVIEVLLFASAMNLGQDWNTVLTLFGSTLTFYVQTWDEYYTKTLTLGLVSGPVEGILTLCIVYAITGIKGGGSYWQQSMLQVFGLPKYSFIPEYLYNLPFTEWYMVYGGIVLVSNTLQSALNVMQTRRKDSKDPVTPLYGLLPYFTTWALVPLYLYLQPIILHHHLIPFVFYIGLINAYSVGQIIIAHLTKNPQFPMYNVLTVPLALAVADSLGPAVGVWPSALGSGTYQIAFVFLCMGLGFGVYGSFVYDIITTICDYLDIWCLTIKHPYNAKDEKKKAK